MVGTRKRPDGLETPPSSIRTPSNSASSSQTLTRQSKFVTRRSSSKSRSSAGRWSHTPSNLTLVWLVVSLPFIVWDCGYVFLRPHSMPGGKWHSPVWTPYGLYGSVDYLYGWPALEKRNGFTGAQAALNVVETLGYYMYLYIVYSRGVEVKTKGRGAPKKIGRAGEIAESFKRLSNARVLSGRAAVIAVVLGYTTAIMTVSKTVLYALNEVFSGFDNVGHNSLWRLIFVWVIPDGAWLVVPSYMIYVFGMEIVQGLEAATA